MKKTLLAILTIVTVLISFEATTLKVNAQTKENFYPQTFVVVEVDEKLNAVTCVDFNGEEWAFYGTEDWQVGDIVSAIMTDKGTSKIYDDEFVTIRYSGWLQGPWGYDASSKQPIVTK